MALEAAKAQISYQEYLHAHPFMIYGDSYRMRSLKRAEIFPRAVTEGSQMVPSGRGQ